VRDPLLGTPIQAFLAYKESKEKLIKTAANKYVGLIETKVYNALIEYEVDIDD